MKLVLNAVTCKMLPYIVVRPRSTPQEALWITKTDKYIDRETIFCSMLELNRCHIGLLTLQILLHKHNQGLWALDAVHLSTPCSFIPKHVASYAPDEPSK